MKAYIVVEPDYGGATIDRVYLDEAEAQAYVDAYNATNSGRLEVEEHPVGAPEGDYDGPLYEASWMARRKLAGEKQLILVSENGFTTVVPSSIPRYRYVEYFTMGEPVVHEYEEPPVWIDSFHNYTTWHTGERPADAAVELREDTRVVVRGTDKAAVEALVREVAAEVKAQREAGL